MRFPVFVEAVARRSGLSPDLAATVARAVLQTVAQRMAGASATDPTGYLPDELSGASSGPEDFLRRVGAHAGVDEQTADVGAAAVFATLREAVTVDEFREMLARLPVDGTIGTPGPGSGPSEAGR